MSKKITINKEKIQVDILELVKSNIGGVMIKAIDKPISNREQINVQSLELKEADEEQELFSDDDNNVMVSIFGKTIADREMQVLTITLDFDNFVSTVQKGANISLLCQIDSLRCLIYEYMFRYIQQ